MPWSAQASQSQFLFAAMIFEYGLRLKKLGFGTQAIHGIAVWHEPFYMKSLHWQLAYSIRNFSLVNGLQFQTPKFIFLRSYICLFMRFILRMEYGAAAAVERGISDYLKGPDALLGAGDEIHADLVRYLAPFKLIRITPAHCAFLSPESLPAPNHLQRLVSLLTFARNLLFFRERRPQLCPSGYFSWLVLQRDAYIVKIEASDEIRLFEKRRAIFWKLLFKMTLTTLRVLLKFKATRTAYNESFDGMISEAGWLRYIGFRRFRDL